MAKASFFRWWALVAVGALGGCAFSPSAPAAASETTVFVVRHAEKAPGGRDPDLTDAGRERAEVLAKRCAAAGVVAAYSTPYQRTFQTAEATASLIGTEVNTSFAPGNEAAMAAHILTEHAGRAVLVVAHSNTMPRVIAGFGAKKIDNLPESAYDRLFVVTISADGAVHLEEQRYGERTPG